jgi:hypothetical protein
VKERKQNNREQEEYDDDTRRAKAREKKQRANEKKKSTTRSGPDGSSVRMVRREKARIEERCGRRGKVCMNHAITCRELRGAGPMTAPTTNTPTGATTF